MKYLVLGLLLLCSSAFANYTIIPIDKKVTRTDTKETTTYGDWKDDVSNAIRITESCKCDVYVKRTVIIRYNAPSSSTSASKSSAAYSSAKASSSSSTSSAASSTASLTTLSLYRPTERSLPDENGNAVPLTAEEIAGYNLYKYSPSGVVHEFIASQLDHVLHPTKAPVLGELWEVETLDTEGRVSTAVSVEL